MVGEWAGRALAILMVDDPAHYIMILNILYSTKMKVVVTVRLSFIQLK